MKILLIHQAFASPQEAGGTRHYELARHVAEVGHEFAIIASDLNYLTGKRKKQNEAVKVSEESAGITVRRAYTFPSLHTSFFCRVLAFLSFMVSSMLVGFRIGHVDLVMGTSPPIFQAASAWALASIRRVPFLLEIRDLWPDFAIDMGVLKNPVLISLSRRLERFLYDRATHIVVNSPAYKNYLLSSGVSADRISLIPNGVDLEMFPLTNAANSFRMELGLQDAFIVTYAGALGLANDIQTILKAAALLQQEREIHFLLVGDGKERPNLERVRASLKLNNVTFVGPKSKNEIPCILKTSDACVATLMNIPMFRNTYPNKVFDYMASAKPTVLAIDGVIRDVLEEAKAGIFVKPGDPKALAEAVLRLYSDRQESSAMGFRGRAFVAKHFNRATHAKQFVDLCARIAKK